MLRAKNAYLSESYKPVNQWGGETWKAEIYLYNLWSKPKKCEFYKECQE